MKLINFKIARDNIAFEKEGEYYDIHNNFDFLGFYYNTAKREIQLNWIKGSGDWVPSNLPKKIDLIIRKVSFLKAQERNDEYPFTEDSCLDCIGFMYHDDLQNMDDYPAYHEPSNDFPHLYLKFMSGFTLKISAENAILNVI